MDRLELGVDRSAIVPRAAATARDGQAALEAVCLPMAAAVAQYLHSGERRPLGIPARARDGTGRPGQDLLHGNPARALPPEHGGERSRPGLPDGGPRLGPTTTFLLGSVGMGTDGVDASSRSGCEPGSSRPCVSRTTGRIRSIPDTSAGRQPLRGERLRPVPIHPGLCRRHRGCRPPRRVRGWRTVIDHLRQIATPPDSARAAYAGGILIDFGTIRGSSSNASRTIDTPSSRSTPHRSGAPSTRVARGPDRTTRRRDGSDGARSRARDSRCLASTAGGGRWRIAHPAGNDVIGHCLDFQLVAAEMRTTSRQGSPASLPTSPRTS